jgi:hypothetical protein
MPLYQQVGDHFEGRWFVWTSHLPTCVAEGNTNCQTRTSAGGTFPNPKLLGKEEIDEKALSGLRGVVKISHTTVNGASLLNFDGFAPASQWAELSSSSSTKNTGSEVA